MFKNWTMFKNIFSRTFTSIRQLYEELLFRNNFHRLFIEREIAIKRSCKSDDNNLDNNYEIEKSLFGKYLYK